MKNSLGRQNRVQMTSFDPLDPLCIFQDSVHLLKPVWTEISITCYHKDLHCNNFLFSKCSEAILPVNIYSLETLRCESKSSLYALPCFLHILQRTQVIFCVHCSSWNSQRCNLTGLERGRARVLREVYGSSLLTTRVFLPHPLPLESHLL